MRKLKHSQFTKQHKSPQGFAMVMALVIMTAVFVMAGSLATTRQMWGFFSTKQLDRSNVEIPARADSASWLLQNRYLLLRNKQITQNTYLFNITNGIVTGVPTTSGPNVNGPANPAVLWDLQYANTTSDMQPFPPFDVLYPDYDTNTFTLTLDPRWGPRTNEFMLTTEQGAYDPYYGITNTGYSWGVVFRREMEETNRESRMGRWDESTTQLRAWASMDASLITYASYRRFPLSAFTLYLTTVSHTTIPSLANLLQPLSTNYNFYGYNVSNVGVGRVYVEGTANFGSNNMVLGFPMVANRGYTNTSQINFHFPSHLGGGSQVVVANPADYKKNRYFVYRGMLASSYDRPQRLIGLHQTNVDPFGSMPIATVISNLYVNTPGSVSVSLGLNTDNPTNVVTLGNSGLGFNGGDINQASRISSTNIWAVDHTNRVVTLRLTNAGFFNSTNFSVAPTSILFQFTGTNASQWVLSVNVPSIANLSSDPNRQKLSLITTGTMVIEPTGFNSDFSGQGSMIVSPMIRVSGTTGSTVNIGGTVFTRSFGTDLRNRTILAYPTTSSPTLTANVVGSMILVSQVQFPPAGSTTAVQLTPDIRYLSGQSIPPVVPTALDMRITGEEMKTYTMFATDPIVLPPAY
jgi:hypothetical protein